MNCRTGSLEMNENEAKKSELVNCRTGSLERMADTADGKAAVNCRTGSLETIRINGPPSLLRELPHRQLRKLTSLIHFTRQT